MEKGKGRVRNFVVSNKELFTDMLARTLCKMQVQYVQVENEFHFNDKIYRFYNFEECLELSGQVSFVCLDNDKIVSLDPQSLLFAKDKDSLNNIFLNPQEDFVPVDENIAYGENESRVSSYTKNQRQRENKKVNQKIKQSDMYKRNNPGYRRQVYKKY